MVAQDKLTKISIVFIAVVILAIVLKTFASFLRPLTLAIIFTLLLMPQIKFFEKKKIPFSIALLGLLLIIVIFIGSFALLVTSSLRESDLFKKTLQQSEDESLEDLGGVDIYSDMFSEKQFAGVNLNLNQIITSERILSYGGKIASALVKGLGVLISDTFLAFIFMIFLIPTHTRLINDIESSLNRVKKKKFISVLLEVEKGIRTYLYTKIMISLGTALVSAVFLLLFGSKHVLILASLVFLLNFVPNIGTIIATGTAIATYAITLGVGMNLLWLSILLVLTQLIFGNILEPKISGDKLKMSPLVILLSLFMWYWIWGIGGMIIAVPLTTIIKIILEHVKSTKYAAEYFS